ncbi:MAG: hypothetical protein KGY41_10635 [Desulfovermiculus sp.]|nr:hypothetical protein [Desulfovermiculus sp.]
MAAPDSASIIDLYDSLLAAEDERARARIIANAFERLEDRYPELKDMVTASGLRETELRLQKEIEQTRLRIEEVRSDLTKEIALGNQKVLRWTTALMFAQLAAIFAALIGVYLM